MIDMRTAEPRRAAEYGTIKLTMGGLDPPIQAYKRWMAGSVAGHGEERVRNFNPKLL